MLTQAINLAAAVVIGLLLIGLGVAFVRGGKS